MIKFSYLCINGSRCYGIKDSFCIEKFIRHRFSFEKHLMDRYIRKLTDEFMSIHQRIKPSFEKKTFCQLSRFLPVHMLSHRIQIKSQPNISAAS